MFVMTARKTLFVILGILMILAGITCFFTPVETSSVIPFIFGLAMVIDGIGRIIAWFSIREYAPLRRCSKCLSVYLLFY